MEFNVNIPQLLQNNDEMQKIQRQLEECNQQLIKINQNMDWQIKSKSQVSRSILNSARSIKTQSEKISRMRTTLNDITSLYKNADKKVLEDYGYVPTYQGNTEREFENSIPQDIKEYLDNIDWNNIDTAKLISSMLLIFSGRYDIVLLRHFIDVCIKKIMGYDTTEYFKKHSDYAKKIQETYDKSSGTARELYDKYKEKIRIKSTNRTSYHRNGILYINTEKGMKDDRGPASTYYHETGHLIVYKNNWVSSNGDFTNTDCAKFDAAVKEDVANYISQIEAVQRSKYSGKYSGDMLESIVKKETTNFLKAELGGSNEDILDGVSDMIDASSNGKYLITYGHTNSDPHYWDLNPTRQANEAFAEMFSADFCAEDSKEINYIREHFPNAYREYENLKMLALNN